MQNSGGLWAGVAGVAEGKVITFAVDLWCLYLIKLNKKKSKQCFDPMTRSLSVHLDRCIKSASVQCEASVESKRLHEIFMCPWCPCAWYQRTFGAHKCKWFPRRALPHKQVPLFSLPRQISVRMSGAPQSCGTAWPASVLRHCQTRPPGSAGSCAALSGHATSWHRLSVFPQLFLSPRWWAWYHSTNCCRHYGCENRGADKTFIQKRFTEPQEISNLAFHMWNTVQAGAGWCQCSVYSERFGF